MSVLGNPISLGGGRADCVLTVTGRNNSASSSWQGVYGGVEWFNSDYFSLQEGSDRSEYICNKGGTYSVYYMIKGGYNTNGSLVNSAIQIRVNGSAVISETTTAATGTTGNGTVTLNEGDTFEMMTHNTTNSSNTHVGAMIVRVSS